MMWGSGMGVGLGWLWMLLVWAIVIGTIIWAVGRLTPSSAPVRAPARQDSARRILDERFARGEIDADEYRRLRDELSR